MSDRFLLCMLALMLGTVLAIFFSVADLSPDSADDDCGTMTCSFHIPEPGIAPVTS